MGEEIYTRISVPLIFIGISVITGICYFPFVKIQSVEPIRFSSDEKVSSESSECLLLMCGSSCKARSIRYLWEVESLMRSIAGGITNDADVEAMAVTINQASIIRWR